MKKLTTKNRIAPTSFESGQIWKMDGSNLRIGTVGKTLVHYKHYRGDTKRAPISLTGKVALGKFLKANKAILTDE